MFANEFFSHCLWTTGQIRQHFVSNVKEVSIRRGHGPQIFQCVSFYDFKFFRVQGVLYFFFHDQRGLPIFFVRFRQGFPRATKSIGALDASGEIADVVLFETRVAVPPVVVPAMGLQRHQRLALHRAIPPSATELFRKHFRGRPLTVQRRFVQIKDVPRRRIPQLLPRANVAQDGAFPFQFQHGPFGRHNPQQLTLSFQRNSSSDETSIHSLNVGADLFDATSASKFDARFPLPVQPRHLCLCQVPLLFLVGQVL